MNKNKEWKQRMNLDAAIGQMLVTAGCAKPDDPVTPEVVDRAFRSYIRKVVDDALLEGK